MNEPSQQSLQDAWLTQYQSLTGAAGLVDVRDRTIVELTGADRAAFLHNFTTNELRGLASGCGCETFLTSVQGKILGHGYVFADDESLTFETVAGEAERVIAHLDCYLIREKVVLRSADDRAELLLAGPQSDEILARLCDGPLPLVRLASARVNLDQQPVCMRRVDWVGPVGFLVDCLRDDLASISQSLVAAGAVQCREEAFMAARIECGTPIYGLDINERNLPQEVDRDRLTISFTKGCYLGQETIARIDALGHVNRKLVGVRFDGAEIPDAGMELSDAGHVVGAVTSATYSPKLGGPLALSYVHRGSNAIGTKLESPLGLATVVQLPI